MKQSLYPLVWIVSCVLALLPGPVQAQGQQTCFPSTFGPNDQVGNLHYVTPEKTLAAAKLMTRGKAYRLGIETNKHTPAFPPRTFSLTVVQPGQVAGTLSGQARPRTTTTSSRAGSASAHNWTGSAISASTTCISIATRRVISCRPTGSAELGIEHVPAIATRAVLLDMAGFFNTDIVKEGTAFNRVEIEGALKRQGMTGIERGDVVLFYTGWTQLIGKDDKRYSAGEPGLDVMARNISRRSKSRWSAPTPGAWR